jgi:hypothetical protein
MPGQLIDSSQPPVTESFTRRQHLPGQIIVSPMKPPLAAANNNTDSAAVEEQQLVVRRPAAAPAPARPHRLPAEGVRPRRRR